MFTPVAIVDTQELSVFIAQGAKMYCGQHRNWVDHGKYCCGYDKTIELCYLVTRVDLIRLITGGYLAISKSVVISRKLHEK